MGAGFLDNLIGSDLAIGAVGSLETALLVLLLAFCIGHIVAWVYMLTLIDERCAHEVRSFARSYLTHDDYARPEMKWAYPTNSVYLDGDGLPLYYSTVHGHKNRFKLRVRYYHEEGNYPVFFEVKRRVMDAIMKDRALVKRDRALRIMAGEQPQISDLVKPDDLDAWSSLKKFCEFRDNIRAKPRVFVAYQREAWVNPENDAVRLTFDRELCGGRYDGTFVINREVHPPPLLAGSPVVLELKFTDRFPLWFREMVRSLNLERRNMAKYVSTTFWIPRKNVLERGAGSALLEEMLAYE